MGEKIREIRLGMCEPCEKDAEKLETLVLQTMPAGISEFFELTELISCDFCNRVKKEIHENPKRFTRRFSLEAIASESSLERGACFVVISLHVVKDAKHRNAYYLPYFQVGFQLQSRYRRNAITLSVINVTVTDGFATDAKATFIDLTNLIACAIKTTGEEGNNSGLVFARILQGVQKAYPAIMRSVYQATKEKIGKGNGPVLCRMYYSQAEEAKRQRKIADGLSVKFLRAVRQIEYLERAMREAAEGIAGTKSTVKSDALQGIRKSLEAALDENKTTQES